MTKRVVKLDRRALRSLISEAIQGREPGSPLWQEPNEPDLKEVLGKDADWAEEAQRNFISEMNGYFGGLWDPNDPSMAQVGRSAWDSQVDQAIERLEDGLNELVSRVESELMNGDYYMPPHGHHRR